MNQISRCISTPLIRFLNIDFKNIKALSSINKDITTQNSLAVQTTDLLINNFKNANSINAVFELVSKHNKIMNSNHTIEALKTIFMLQRHSDSRMSTSQISKHPEFEKICNQLKYYAGTMELKDTIVALKVLSFVGVSSETIIYQMLLQLLKHNINQLSLQQIVFLDFLLSKVKPCPLVEALRIALPIIYDIQLPAKLGQIDLSVLSDHLHYVSKKDVSVETITLILNSLMKVKVFDAKSSVSIIWSVCDMPANTLFESILNKAIKSVFINGHSISYQDLETMISKLVTKYSSKTPFYYNEALFDYCTNVLINEDLGFENAVHLLKKFLKVSHVSNDLLNYISEKCYQNSDLIENGDLIHTYYVICGCALTNFRPKYYDVIKESFLKIKSFKSLEHKDINFIQFQTSLSILDIYVPEILEKSLNEDYINNALKRKFIADFENILLILQAIKTFRPEFSNYIPKDDLIYTINSRIKRVHDYPLKGLLHHVFGGEKFVKTQVPTKLFHYVDHLIVLKKNGLPSALNLEDIYVEDIHCESPGQIVLVMVLKQSHYTINNRQYKGTTTLFLQTLEAKGYVVVPICLELWKTLPEFEKLPFIMEAIKSKTQNFDSVYGIS